MPSDEANPGFIEIPGGHVEDGESLEDALRRELEEELGIRVGQVSFVTSGLATATNGKKGRIHYFRVGEWDGRIRAKEAERVYWEARISRLSLPSDRKAVRKVLKSPCRTP